MLIVQASSRRRSKAVKSHATGSSDDETSRLTEPSRKCSSESARMSTTSTSKSARTVVSSSDSESSSSSSEDEADPARHRSASKPTPTSTSVSKSRLITSSSDSDDSSDDDVPSVLKSRATSDKSKKTPATSTPLQRQSIYTSSDNDDSDSDSFSGTPLKKAKPSLSTSTPSSSKAQPKKAAQSAIKKPSSSTPNSKAVSKPCVPRESSTDSDATAVTKSSKPVVKDAKKQHKTADKDGHPDSVLGSIGHMSKKDVKKPTNSTSDKPIPHRHVSSVFADALAKSAAHAKAGSKSALCTKDEKVRKKDFASSRTVDMHKSTSSLSAASSTKQKQSHTDVDSLKSKHSISESRHAPKSSSGSAEKKPGSERALKSGYDLAPENIGRKMLESETLKTNKLKPDERHGEKGSAAEAESDESPLIRPGNIFEKMEKQETSTDKTEDARMFGRDVAAHRRSLASEIAVFMPESDDDDREPIVETAKLSIERLKEDSAKEETIEEAVKAIIEFTKEPSTPPLSSSKTDSEPLEDSGETADDDMGLSDDVGELNAAIGNLIEKELEPTAGGDGLTSDKGSVSDSSVTSPTHYRPSTHAQPKNELSSFVGTNNGGSVKEEHGSMDSVARHMQTSAHDEQNVTSFMSRLEKATADAVDFAAISAAAAASKKAPEKPSSEAIPCSKPDVSSRLFASAIDSAPVKTEDEKPAVVKKEESSEQVDAAKPEPPESLPSTRIYSSSKQPEVHGSGSVEKASVETVNGDDSSTMADLYEFKDDDDDETSTRQKDFVLHKRSRKRLADSESNDGADVDAKKLRSSGGGAGSHVKAEQHETSSAVTTEPCSTTTTTSDCQPVSSQSTWQRNMDLVIDAVARGEFERGDDFNYYSTQNAATSGTGKARRGRAMSRDDAAHKAVPASTAGCLASSLPTVPVEGFSASYQRPLPAVAVGSSPAVTGGRCSPKLLLPGMSSQQIQQLQRIYPPGSLATTCKSLY